ncbi:MAG: portal protein, partial [Candidatus Poseidoniales archaeon]
RLRYRFSELFHILLERQLLLKGIITKQEWSDIKGKIFYDFLEDNHFSELKNAEMMRERLNTLRDIDEYVGKYYSTTWVRKNVLMMTEEEIEEMDQQIADEPSEEDEM